MIRTLLSRAACLVLGVDTLDGLELARRVVALHQVAKEAEDRAEVAEAAAEEYRLLYLEAEVTIRQVEREAAGAARDIRAVTVTVERWIKRALRAEDELEVQEMAACHDLAILAHNARVARARRGTVRP